MLFCSVEVLGRCEGARRLGVPPLQPAASRPELCAPGWFLHSFALSVLMSLCWLSVRTYICAPDLCCE